MRAIDCSGDVGSLAPRSPDIAAFARRLRDRGKPGKVILVAVMRKLPVRLNAAVRDALDAKDGICLPVASAAA